MSNGDRKDQRIDQIKVKVSHPAGIKAPEGTDKLAEEANALRGTLNFLSERIDQLAANMEKSQLKEYVNLMQKPWTLIFKNLLSGMARGVGYAIGFSFFAAVIVYVLQWIGALNLPIVGDYIADIVRVVQRQLEIDPR
ncbi:DUF5665 domain-containing protein [Cohnella sp. GCM10027633]|uniref:DUF5665 domain-containing protein n=1 Tax=unclassified Cohnella TaxID=2636738 RepID=UPI003628BC24